MNKDTGVVVLAIIGFFVVLSFVLGLLGSIFWVALKFIFPLLVVIGAAKLVTCHVENKKRKYN